MSDLSKLAEARLLLREQVFSSGDDLAQDRAKCPGCQFRKGNKFLPARHPAWAHEPPHICWLGRVKEFLKD